MSHYKQSLFIFATALVVSSVACKTHKVNSDNKVSPVAVESIRQNKHWTKFFDKSIDLTTFKATNAEIEQIKKDIEVEFLQDAENRGNAAGGSFQMSDLELGLIFAYTGNAKSDEWNNYLRNLNRYNETLTDVQKKQRLSWEAEIKLAASALNKLKVTDAAYTGRVFRGEKRSPESLNAITKACEQGQIVMTHSFFSSSLNIDVAKHFSRVEPGSNRKSIIYHVDVEEETKLEDYTEFDSESEVLVNPNTIFQVIAMDSTAAADGKMHIYMIELNPKTLKTVTENRFTLPATAKKCQLNIMGGNFVPMD